MLTTTPSASLENDKNISTEPLTGNTPKDCLTQIAEQIETILNLLKLQTSQPNKLKEALCKISWRSSEIPTSIKFNTKSGILAIFSGRNWLLLEYLANALTQIDEKMLPAIVDSLKEDFEKFKDAIPIIIEVINGKKINEPNKLVLTKLEQFVGFYFDKYLLNKIIQSSNVILSQINGKNKEKNLHFLSNPLHRKSLYRVFEIIGEATKNLTSTLKSLDEEHSSNGGFDKKDDFLGSFRNKIHHDRLKLELIYQIKPELFSELIKILKIINERAKTLFYTHNSTPITETDYQALNKLALSKISIPFWNKDTDRNLKSSLEKLKHLTGFLEFNSNLSIQEINFLLNLAKKESRHEFIIFFTKPDKIIDENDFANNFLQFIDLEKVSQNNLKTEEIKQKLTSAYKKLVNKKITSAEYNNYTKNFQDFDVQNFKEIFRSILLKLEDSNNIEPENLRVNIKKLPFLTKNHLDILNNFISALTMKEEKRSEIINNFSLNQHLEKMGSYSPDKDPFNYLESIQKTILSQVSSDKTQTKSVIYRHILDNHSDFVDIIIGEIFKTIPNRSAKDLLTQALTEENLDLIFSNTINKDKKSIKKDSFEKILKASGLITDTEFKISVENVEKYFHEFNKILEDPLFNELGLDDQKIIEERLRNYVTSVINSTNFEHNIEQQIIKERETINNQIANLKGNSDNQKSRKILDVFLKNCTNSEKEQMINDIIQNHPQNYQAKIESILHQKRNSLLEEEKRKKERVLFEEISNFIKPKNGNELEIFSKLYKQAVMPGDEPTDSTIAIVYSKLKIKQSFIEPTYESIKIEFQKNLEEIASIFNYINTKNKSSLLNENELSFFLEYHIETSGQIAERLFKHKDFSESEHISFSQTYLNLLAICRKSMAHHPLEINKPLINYIIRKLALDTRLRVEKDTPCELQSISTGTLVSESLLHKSNIITIQSLEKHKIDIFLNIEGLGFKNNFKIFHKTLGCDIGLQGDICFLVTPATESDENIFNMFELEIRLSKLLGANVHVYTDMLLENNNRLKVNNDDFEKIKKSAKPLESVIIEYKFAKIFKNNAWSSAQIPNIGKFDISDYIEKRDIENILFFIFEKNIGPEELKSFLERPDVFSETINKRFLKFNTTKESSIILSKILQDIMNKIISPFVLKYDAVRIPTGASLENGMPIVPIIRGGINQPGCFLPRNYPAHIYNNFQTTREIPIESSQNNELTISALSEEAMNIQEFWECIDKIATTSKNGSLFYERSRLHYMLSGSASLIEQLNDGSIIVETEGFKVRLSSVEVDLLYIKRDNGEYQKFDVNLPGIIYRISQYQNFDGIEHISKYIATIFNYSKERLEKIFDPRRKIDPSVFSLSSSVNHAFDSEILKLQYNNKKSFRQERLEKNESLKKIILQKAKDYIDSIILILKQEQNKNQDNEKMNHLLELLMLDKEIDQKLNAYYLDNEEAILKNKNMHDERQIEARFILENLKLLDTPIGNKEAFCNSAKNDPNLIKDESLKLEIRKLLDNWKKSLILLSDSFISEDVSNFKPKEDTVDNRLKSLFGGEQVYPFLFMAYEYYKKFDVILDQISNPDIIKLLFKFSSGFSLNISKENIYQLAYSDFSDRYVDPTNIDTFITLDGEKLTRLSFSGEIECCNTERKICTLENIKQKGIFSLIKTIIDQEINTLSSLTLRSDEIKFEYTLPIFLNGILSSNSDLDDDLQSIHFQIAHHQIKRQKIKPGIFVEELPLKIWRATNFSKQYPTHISGTSVFKIDIKTLDDLMSSHDWTDEEITLYKKEENYQEDSEKIKQYYEFKEKLDLLKTSVSYSIEYEKRIIQTYSDMNAHLSAGRKTEVQELKLYLKRSIFAYENNINQQQLLIDLIMNLPFTKKRIYSAFNNADGLEKILSNLEFPSSKVDLVPQNQVLRATELVRFVLFQIREHTKKELIIETHLNALKNGSEIDKIKIALKNNESTPLPHLNKTNKKPPDSYPGLLFYFGVRKNKMTGPRVATALKAIKKEQGEAIALEVADHFKNYVKAHHRHFNMRRI